MTNQELIKGMYAIRAMIESHKDTYPIQTENQIKVIDEVIERLERYNMIDFDTIKELFKESIDESHTMNEALQRLFDKVYNKGKSDAENKEKMP